MRRFGSATHGKAGGSLVALWISIEAGQARDRHLAGAASGAAQVGGRLVCDPRPVVLQTLVNQRPHASQACGTGYRQGRTLWFGSVSAAAAPFCVMGVRSGGDGRVGSDVSGWRADS